MEVFYLAVEYQYIHGEGWFTVFVNIKGKDRVSEITLIHFLFMIKIIIFNHLTMIHQGRYLLLLISFIYFAFFCISIYYLFTHQRKKWILFIFYTCISFVMFSDVMYFQYFDQLPSLKLINQVKQLGSIKESIVYLIRPINFIFFIDIIPLAFFIAKKNNENLSFLGGRKNILFYTTGFLVIFMTFLILWIPSNEYSVKILQQELFSYHIYDLYKILSGPQEMEAFQENELLEHLQNSQKGLWQPQSKHKYFGVAKGRNLIVIQVESLQDFVINRFYDGQEITPNLNKLIEKDSMYFDKYYQQLGRGNTSDAEFVTNNSLYPAMDGYTYDLYAENKYYGLPWILKEENYKTIALHGYKGAYWNRQKAYPNQGFDMFISEKNYILKESIGFGLSDKEFFKQSIPYLKEMDQPYYAFFVTLSSHHPYTIPEKYHTLKLRSEHKGTLFGNYLQSIRYVDAAIGEFIETLKREDLYENAMICVYGDHYGLSVKDDKNVKIMTDYLGYPYDLDEMLNVPLIIHVPKGNITKKNSIVGGQIDFMPTVLNLMGVRNNRGIWFGQDLNNAESGFVAQQTYMIKGSFIDDTKVFEMSRDGIFDHSRAWDIQTKEPVDIQLCRAGYERAIREINKSDYILENNWLARGITKEQGWIVAESSQKLEPEKYIAHAGGRIGKYTYTNSREALDASYKKGYRFIELDFEWTIDKQLVLLHSWDQFVQKFFSKEIRKYSYDEFKNFKMINGWHQLTLEDLANWLKKHRDVYIITDIKKDNVEGLKLIAQNYPDLQNQIIPQIYKMEEYLSVQNLGYRNVILTLYRTNYSDEDVVDFCIRNKLLAVTMPLDRAKTDLPQKLKKHNVFIYTHTVNDPKVRDTMLKNGVDGFYTDDLLDE